MSSSKFFFRSDTYNAPLYSVIITDFLNPYFYLDFPFKYLISQKIAFFAGDPGFSGNKEYL
jgi:hypothetical protein